VPLARRSDKNRSITGPVNSSRLTPAASSHRDSDAANCICIVADVVVYPSDASSTARSGANGATGPSNRTLDGSGTLCTTVLLSRRSHGENSLNHIRRRIMQTSGLPTTSRPGTTASTSA
jgi:hypothetical protein